MSVPSLTPNSILPPDIFKSPVVIVETPLTPVANISLQVTTPTASFLKLSNTASSDSITVVPIPTLSDVVIPAGPERIKNPLPVASPIGPCTPNVP